MKFYEFDKGYQFYALIADESEEKAIKHYIGEVEGGSEEEFNQFYGDIKPVEITKDMALEKYIEAEECGILFKFKEDIIKDFENKIKLFNHVVLLIDGSLI